MGVIFGPIIQGQLIRLQPLTKDMIPLFCRWFADLEVTRYLVLRFPPSPGMEAEWLERTARSDVDVVWAITVDGRPIGSIGIHASDWRNRRASTGIMIGERSEWGKGYASEAMRLRTRFAFEELGLEKLSTWVFTENKGSIRALEKAGYKGCGLARKHEYRRGRWHDAWLGEVLREEWAGANSEPGVANGSSS